MSATFAEPIATVAPEIEVRPSIRTEIHPETRIAPTPVAPRQRVATHSRPKSATQKSKAHSIGTIWTLRMTMFVVLGSVTWSASSLMGQVMAESARREGIRAQARASVAMKTESALRQEVDQLTSDESVEAWAQSHGMVALDGFDKATTTERKGLVALNR